MEQAALLMGGNLVVEDVRGLLYQELKNNEIRSYVVGCGSGVEARKVVSR